MKLLEDANIEGKKVLLRADFNVPIKDGKVADDERIKTTIPTIKFLLEKNCSIILASHLGRPKGKIVDDLRLTPVAKKLSELLKMEVKKSDSVVGQDSIDMASELKPKEILLLENVQFEPGEKENSEEYGKKLASLAQAYVLEAFGQAHREYASLTQVEKFIPSYAGFLLTEEIKALSPLVSNPEKPFIAVLGGAKVSDKIGLIKNLMDKVDKFLIGGAMIFPFYKAKGFDIGTSKCEDESVEIAKELLASGKIVLPVDLLCAESIGSREFKEVLANEIPKDMMGLDIGPKSIETYREYIKPASTILWNGPLGYSENEIFTKATIEIGKEIGQSNAFSVVGGGDTLLAISQLGLSGYNHISTGGGAMLDFLSGKELPGIKALSTSK